MTYEGVSFRMRSGGQFSAAVDSSEAANVWTGGDVLHWGGTVGDGTQYFADGFSYDPSADTWSPIEAAPIEARASTAAVWTGSALLVWGGEGASGKLGDGAEFNPETKTWTRLTESPLSPRVPLGYVWTGNELFIWGARGGEAQDGAAYNPTTDSWRSLPPAPITLSEGDAVWSGREMILVGGELGAGGAPLERSVTSAAYSPESDSWRVLASTDDLLPQSTEAVWYRDAVIAWDWYRLRPYSLNPDEGDWTAAGDIPLEPFECATDAVIGEGVVFGQRCWESFTFDGVDWEDTSIGCGYTQPPTPIAAGDGVVVLAEGAPGNASVARVFVP